jgi:hypothetical protein
MFRALSQQSGDSSIVDAIPFVLTGRATFRVVANRKLDRNVRAVSDAHFHEGVNLRSGALRVFDTAALKEAARGCGGRGLMQIQLGEE